MVILITASVTTTVSGERPESYPCERWADSSFHRSMIADGDDWFTGCSLPSFQSWWSFIAVTVGIRAVSESRPTG